MTDDNVKTDNVETPEVPEVNHVSSMVNSLADGDNVAAQASFKNALQDKIGQALDDKRVSVANNWLNAAQDLETTQDASGLDKLGQEKEPTPEPVELEDGEAETGKEDEQPVVQKV